MLYLGALITFSNDEKNPFIKIDLSSKYTTFPSLMAGIFLFKRKRTGKLEGGRNAWNERERKERLGWILLFHSPNGCNGTNYVRPKPKYHFCLPHRW